MTRATHAVLHGHPLAALRFNFLAMTLMPVLLFGLVLELIGWMRDTANSPGLALQVLAVAIVLGGLLVLKVPASVANPR